MHHLVTIVAKYFILLVLLIAFVVWLKLNRSRKYEFIILGVLAAILAVILAKLSGHIINDPRPFVTGHFTPYFAHSSDNGFPSDHMLLGSLVAFVTFKYNRLFGSLAFFLALLVGIARVIAGVHHVADIAGSIIIAAISYAIVNAVLTWYKKNKTRAGHNQTPAGH